MPENKKIFTELRSHRRQNCDKLRFVIDGKYYDVVDLSMMGCHLKGSDRLDKNRDYKAVILFCEFNMECLEKCIIDRNFGESPVIKTLNVNLRVKKIYGTGEFGCKFVRITDYQSKIIGYAFRCNFYRNYDKKTNRIQTLTNSIISFFRALLKIPN